MVWTVSQNATTLTITPDGTSSENLSTILDLAISTLGVNAGVTKPSLYTYESTKKILIAADVSTNHLVVSGLNLTIRDQFIRASNSRVRFGNVNAAGAVVGKANIILAASLVGFTFNSSPFTVSGSNAFLAATDLTLIFRRVISNSGAVINGFDVSNLSVGSFANCSFQSDSNGDSSNAIYYFSAENYTNCSFLGWSACEFSQPETLIKDCTFETINVLKNATAGNYYLENVVAIQYQVRNGGSILFINCTIGSLISSAQDVNNVIDLRNSLELLGGTNEASGLFVARLPNNTQVYKRTFNASGLISGGNSTGATNGIISSSERLLISVYRLAGNPLAF